MNMLLDFEGEEILDACNCDLNFLCNFPPCQMAYDLTARFYAAQFASGALTAAGLAEGWLELDEYGEPTLTRA